MLHVYINYPEAHIRIHQKPDCKNIKKMNKEGQRTVKINVQTLTNEIDNFLHKKYRFASEQTWNDMWLEVDFEGDSEFEKSNVYFLHSILKRHYKPFRNIEVENHC